MFIIIVPVTKTLKDIIEITSLYFQSAKPFKSPLCLLIWVLPCCSENCNRSDPSGSSAHSSVDLCNGQLELALFQRRRRSAFACMRPPGAHAGHTLYIRRSCETVSTFGLQPLQEVTCFFCHLRTAKRCCRFW